MSCSWYSSLPTHPSAPAQPPSIHLIAMVWRQFVQSSHEESLQPHPVLLFYAGVPPPPPSCSFLLMFLLMFNHVSSITVTKVNAKFI